MYVSWMREKLKNVAEYHILGGDFSKQFTKAEQGRGDINGGMKGLY